MGEIAVQLDEEVSPNFYVGIGLCVLVVLWAHGGFEDNGGENTQTTEKSIFCQHVSKSELWP